MMVTYLPRSAWDARASRGGTSLVASQVDGYTLHWPGMSGRIDAAGDIGKRRVASALRGWQNYHMDVRGWSDIAYMIAIDQAGRAWTLRGINIRSGANGNADVNRRYGAFLLVLGPGEKPSAAMEETVREVGADFCRRFSGSRKKPYGHGEVRPDGTDCPGPAARAAIAAGEFTPGSTTTPPAGDEDEMNEADFERLDQRMQDWSDRNVTATRQQLAGFKTEMEALFALLKAQVNNFTASVDSINDTAAATSQATLLAKLDDIQTRLDALGGPADPEGPTT